MKINITITMLLLVVGVSLTAFVKKSSNEKFDYLTVHQSSWNLNISSTTGAFQELNVKGQKPKNIYDFTPALIKVSEFEDMGWEYVESTTFSAAGGSAGICITMRKKK